MHTFALKHEPTKVKREPCITIREAAKEFGVTFNQLRCIMMADQTHPKAVEFGGAKDRNRILQYRGSELRQWWRQRNAKRAA